MNEMIEILFFIVYREADLPFQCDSIENPEIGISTQTEEKCMYKIIL
jgi:hypothetical protein